MLASLYLIPDTLTSPKVARFIVNHEVFTTFWTLEFFVNSSVVVEGPSSSQSLAAFVAVVLLGVQVNLLHVLYELILPVILLGA